MRHAVMIYWSEADQAFIAEVPELPGCMADGPTKAKALQAVETVAKEWIETAKLVGGQSVCPRVGGRTPNAPGC